MSSFWFVLHPNVRVAICKGQMCGDSISRPETCPETQGHSLHIVKNHELKFTGPRRTTYYEARERAVATASLGTAQFKVEPMSNFNSSCTKDTVLSAKTPRLSWLHWKYVPSERRGPGKKPWRAVPWRACRGSVGVSRCKTDTVCIDIVAYSVFTTVILTQGALNRVAAVYSHWSTAQRQHSTHGRYSKLSECSFGFSFSGGTSPFCGMAQDIKALVDLLKVRYCVFQCNERGDNVPQTCTRCMVVQGLRHGGARLMPRWCTVMFLACTEMFAHCVPKRDRIVPPTLVFVLPGVTDNFCLPATYLDYLGLVLIDVVV
ncbi:hypothetical protein B0H16DRAFT_1463738 [Mycena metata]|uniref:Uncharacterized protein n=1 Tax=Mycena metata TaxID=1033252 RepID=A0AAD7IHS0_9AGAR|nr:hypothetical protein B0H16DRAFT_1463738 [Mycena metata]